MQPGYILGSSAVETDRLRKQADFLREDSAYLLRRAGITEGMRVLDVGCGVGDVSIALAELVGPSGSVTAVDQDVSALATAQRRARAAGMANIEFTQAALSDLSLDEPVDALVGRLILMHLPDPVETVRKLTRSVRPGGVVTFQESVNSMTTAKPEVSLMDRAVRWMCEASRAAGVDPDTGRQLFRIFREAGLPPPELASCQGLSGDPESDLFANVVQAMTAIEPIAAEHGLTIGEDLDLETLTERVRNEVVAQGAVTYGPVLIGAWCRTDGPLDE